MNLNGFKVVKNDLLVVSRTTKTKRSWSDRLFKGLFTKEWAPMKSHNVTVEHNIPDDRLIITEDMIVGHPVTIDKMLSLINEKGA